MSKPTIIMRLIDKKLFMGKIQPIIMAGGFGTRLWPVSSRNKPKQFHHFTDNLSLFQQTIIRNAVFAKPIVLLNKTHLKIALKQIKATEVSCKIIVEQEPSGTAICGLLSALSQVKDEEACIALLPADHNILEQLDYVNCIVKASKLASDMHLVTIGINPSCPSKHYGYIQCGEEIVGGGCFSKSFVEKPSVDVAQKYLDMGGFLWNSGIFLYQPKSFLAIASKLAPELVARAENMWQRRKNIGKLIYLPKAKFSQKISFDRAFAEKISKLAVVQGNFAWSDLGTFRSLFESACQPNKGNSLSPNTYVCDDVEKCWVMHDKKFAVVLGIKQACVISSGDYLLISSYDKLDELERKLESLNKPLSKL